MAAAVDFDFEEGVSIVSELKGMLLYDVAGKLAEVAAENERLRAALLELLESHDNLYVSRFGDIADPCDDIATKAARDLLWAAAVRRR